MKQRTAVLLPLLLGFIIPTLAQDTSGDYMEFNDRKNVVHGVYLGLTTHYGEIDDKDSYFTSFKVAYVANQQFEIGFIGTFFYSDQNIYRGISSYDEDLIGGYGGLHLEPIFFSKNLVSLSFPVLIGAGGMGYIDDNYSHNDFDEDEFEDNAQAFFIVEPGINALFNISRYLQLEAGVKYRISNKVNDSKNFDPVKRINGFSAGIGVKVGIFNMGRNRYKKNI
ncbi:hypothetical protein [Arenibacter sp. F20364]|uniref:hypothetical protein n=1 Tax=Arenibacter sp. F20364 TaxID=2926415 RepID=UPI001FF389E1|nr:hypothetical protein [Arenibacter sp. F20364]MCK0192082.1 hypothetical protein [Arenibacter sp. F20364]